MKNNPANELIMRVAFSQLGTTEIPGDMDNPTIVKYFAEIGHKWVKDDETAWCAAFWNWCAKMAFAEMSGKLNAQSFLKIGDEVSINRARYGDTVILWRGSPSSWKGHVGGLVGWSSDKSRVYLIGGNQSNRVKVSSYDANRIKGIRRLEIVQDFEIAKA